MCWNDYHSKFFKYFYSLYITIKREIKKTYSKKLLSLSPKKLRQTDWHQGPICDSEKSILPQVSLSQEQCDISTSHNVCEFIVVNESHHNTWKTPHMPKVIMGKHTNHITLNPWRWEFRKPTWISHLYSFSDRTLERKCWGDSRTQRNYGTDSQWDLRIYKRRKEKTSNKMANWKSWWDK